MRNYDEYQNYNGPNRQHLIAAVIAVILSVAMHTALIMTLPGLKLSASLAANKDHQDLPIKKMRLTDVIMPDSNDVEKEWSGDVGPGDLSKLLDLEQSAEELVLSPDKTTKVWSLIQTIFYI